jgi:hypothetical protein
LCDRIELGLLAKEGWKYIISIISKVETLTRKRCSLEYRDNEERYDIPAVESSRK